MTDLLILPVDVVGTELNIFCFSDGGVYASVSCGRNTGVLQVAVMAHGRLTRMAESEVLVVIPDPQYS